MTDDADTEPNLPPPGRILIPLFAIQFFAWSGMFVLWINAYPLITRFVMHAAPANEAAMRQGLVVISLCFSFYATAAACMAFALPWLIARWGEGWVLGVALLFGAAGLASLGFVDRPLWLAPGFAGIAVAWSALSNLPYAIAGSAVHWTRISHILRIFSFSTILPQVAVSLGLALFGAVVFGSATQDIMFAGGASMAVGAVLCILFRRRLTLKPVA